jgi:hypothetical protein
MASRSQVQIFAALDRSEDGAQLHAAFIAAAEGAGDGWVRLLVYPIVTSQCSSTTLYQVSYHIQ